MKQKPKILIIEDNLEIRENTAEILMLAGFEIDVAENGKLGIKKIDSFGPDLIICDIMMPELDGYGVLNILSRNPDTASIPFIFLTAKSERADFRKGMNLGADDYIIKPFDESDLIQSIEVRLERSKKLQKLNSNSNDLHEFVNDTKAIQALNNLCIDRKEKKYSAKEPIFREGDYANYLYFLKSGCIKCVKTDNYGKEFVTELIYPSSYFGYIALLEDGEQSESAIAMESSEVTIIPKDDFKKLVQTNRDVAVQFIKKLAGNVRKKEEQLLQLAYTPVRERVAAILVKLGKNEDGSLKTISVMREDLANMAGTAKESLIRILSEMKKDGLISISGRTIEIENLVELEGLVLS
ncbi:response regulator [Crocinitomix algicola]|uniref:response regulator n=1 Tax=Crocinitomix algicola TaxID=1740263 RepID=UPI0008313F85|nr:response regulator [Crocinitomix algicola]